MPPLRILFHMLLDPVFDFATSAKVSKDTLPSIDPSFHPTFPSCPAIRLFDTQCDNMWNKPVCLALVAVYVAAKQQTASHDIPWHVKITLPFPSQCSPNIPPPHTHTHIHNNQK